MKQHYPLDPVTGIENPALAWANGNPATGTNGSYPPFGLFLDPQKEILAAQRAGGLSDSADGSDTAQLAQAISRGTWLGQLGQIATANDLTAALPGSIVWPLLLIGMEFAGVISAPNTGAMTVTLTGFGTLPGKLNLVSRGGGALSGGDVPANVPFKFRYDGAQFRLTGAVASEANPAPVVYPGGTAQSGGFYAMDLGTLQVFTLPNPATITAGWTCDLLVTGTPSGYQTAYAQIAAGGSSTALTYRGTAHTPFYLTGNGEIFRFKWTGTFFLVYTLCQPASFGIYLDNPVASSNVGGTGAVVYLPISRVQQTPGAAAAFSRSASAASVGVHVSGIYQIIVQSKLLGQDATYRQATLYAADSTALGNIYLPDPKSVSNAFTVYPSVAISAYLKQGSSLSGVLQIPSGMSYDVSGSVFSVFLQQR